MNKYIFVLIFCSVALGCASTKVFMGSYDVVKIAVSPNQARMTAENLPHETQLLGKKLERKISEEPICIDTTDSDSCKAINFNGKLHVTIVCSDENLAGEFSKYFCKDGFSVEEKFHKPSSKSTTIAEVTIYPKRKDKDDPEGEYHLIEFKTRGDLSGGTHRFFVKEPVAFVFKFMKIKDETKKINMLITYSNIIKNCDFIVKEKETILPDKSKLQILSKIISKVKKPISVVFVRIY